MEQAEAHEEPWYNLFLEQHRLVEGQNYGERASDEAMAAMVAMNPNIIPVQRAFYEASHSQCVTRNAEEAPPDEDAATYTLEAHVQAVEDENAVSCTSYALSSNFWGHTSQADIGKLSRVTIDLTSISMGGKYVADSSENE
ncbi:hypothetical protein D1007_34288 [Hordeum vulgare]|nr:hypothetical protein D1007_34288 [Hordeum vulgare]